MESLAIVPPATLPASIGALAFVNKAIIYDLLFRVAAETPTTISDDPKHLGSAQPIHAPFESWNHVALQPLASQQNGRSGLHDFRHLNLVNFQFVVEMTGVRRVPALDGLRGIAALSVMAFHFNIFFLPQAGLSKFVPFLNRAYLAVDLFFLLSGFVMAHVLWAPTCGELAYALAGVCAGAIRAPLSSVRHYDIGDGGFGVPIPYADRGIVLLFSIAGTPAAHVTTVGFWPELELSILVNQYRSRSLYLFYLLCPPAFDR